VLESNDEKLSYLVLLENESIRIHLSNNKKAWLEWSSIKS